jgi:hypothetical protein
MAKKRQTFGKMVRERERAEKRARKQEKKEERKLEAAADSQAEALGYPVPVDEDEFGIAEGEGPLAEADAQEPPRAREPAG